MSESICEARVSGTVIRKNINYSSNNKKIVTFTVKNRRPFINFKGENDEILSWHTVHCAGALTAEAEEFEEGDEILVTGFITNRVRKSGPCEGQYVYALHATELKAGT